MGSRCPNLDAGVSDEDIVLRPPELRPSAFYPERTREGQLHLVLILKLDKIFLAWGNYAL